MAKVTFGCKLPCFPVYGESAEEYKARIVAAMDVVDGVFDSIWFADHPYPGVRWTNKVWHAIPNMEGWTVLNYYAARYTQAKFGHMVLANSYRNPAMLAKMAATLSFLSGGRFILGIGAGWKDEEYRAYGYPFPKASVRIAQLEEGLQIIKRLWTEKQVTFHGKYFQVEEAYCEPKPAPVPPILIGGGGEQLTLRVVARYADWWNCSGTITQYKHKQEVLKKHCRAVGRRYEEIRQIWNGCVAIAETEEEARDIASRNPFITEVPDAYEKINLIVGTPEQIIDRIEELAGLGLDYFVIRFLDVYYSTRGTSLFIDQVMNAFT
jgi:alkanesulfonate monooxygenase SsuD/methylene tetrahydromethanopterin reductase-like flavin-dependent oxidoreductase (luciferase family)